MFSKSDPGANLKRMRVTMKMRSGESETGSLLVPAHRALREALNDEAPFLELETEDGAQAFVLKTEIARIDPLDGPEPRADDRPANNWSRFDAQDAYLVLGLSPETSPDAVHTAWRDLAKAYHPDRLAALGLPDEMLRHADRVLARINAAFQRLKAEGKARGA